MYVLDHKAQGILLSEMTMLRKDNETLEAYYYHPSTERMWKSFFPRANDDNRGRKVLRTEPVPEQLDEWLKECLTDTDLEDAHGLGLEFSALPQQWEVLMELIEQNYRNYGRKQLRTFFKNIEITNYETSFDELNIHLEEIEIERNTLDKLARRTKIIRFKRFWFF